MVQLEVGLSRLFLRLEEIPDKYYCVGAGREKHILCFGSDRLYIYKYVRVPAWPRFSS